MLSSHTNITSSVPEKYNFFIIIIIIIIIMLGQYNIVVYRVLATPKRPRPSSQGTVTDIDGW